MSSPLEALLRPGEEVRFERHPLGLPPLSGRMLAAYGVILAIAALPALSGDLIAWPIGKKLVLPLPYMALALLGVAIVEVVRFAEFRSRLYVVTSERVLVFAGLLHATLRGEVERSRIRGIQLLGAEPAIALEEKKLVLTGLDAVDLESVRASLGDPPLLPAATLTRSRRSRRTLALLLLVVFAAFIELEGWIQRWGTADFKRTTTQVGLAVIAAEAAVSSLVATETGDPVERKCGELDNSTLFTSRKDFTASMNVDAEVAHPIVSAQVRCTRTRNAIPLHTGVEVIRGDDRPENARFLDELRKELARRGIEATWPR